MADNEAVVIDWYKLGLMGLCDTRVRKTHFDGTWLMGFLTPKFEMIGTPEHHQMVVYMVLDSDLKDPFIVTPLYIQYFIGGEWLTFDQVMSLP